MKIRFYNENRLTYNDNPSQLMINLLWYSLIIVDIIRKIPINEMAVSFLRNGLYILVFAYVIIDAVKHRRIEQLLIPGLSFIILLGFSLLLYPSLSGIVEDNILLFYVRCLTGFYLALNIINWKKVIIGIVKWHWVGLFYSLLVTSIDFKYSDNYMSFSYGLLVPAFITLVYGFVERKIIYFLSGCIMIMSLFTFGARGPLLCICVACFFLVLELPKRSISLKKIFSSIIVLLLFVILIISYDNMIGFLSQKFTSARNVLLLISGKIGAMSGRDFLYVTTLDKILENPFLPNGFLSDRILLGGGIASKNIYPHNFFLEIIYQFGIFGWFFLFWFIYTVLRIYRSILRKEDYFMKFAFVSFFIITIVKLMITGSYVSDMQSWFAFGCLGSMINLFSKSNYLNS